MITTLLRLFHRRADQVAPFGPRAVVILHVVEPEQVLHREPRQARALADTAVGDHRLVSGNPFLRVERPQLIEALERAVVVAVLAPRDALGARDVTAALAGF